MGGETARCIVVAVIKGVGAFVHRALPPLRRCVRKRVCALPADLRRAIPERVP